jgi:hypothetical protein
LPGEFNSDHLRLAVFFHRKEKFLVGPFGQARRGEQPGAGDAAGAGGGRRETFITRSTGWLYQAAILYPSPNDDT